MERVQPISKENSPMTIRSGDVEGKATQISGPSLLEAKPSNNDPRGSAPPTNLLDSTIIASQKKPEMPERNVTKIPVAGTYRCKYCKAKFGTWQSLGGHQNAHRREHVAEKRAQVMNQTTNAISHSPNPYYFGMQAAPVPKVPIPRNPAAFWPCTWSVPANAFRPMYRATPKPTTIANPNYFGMQVIPASGHPIAYRPHAWPAPAGVVKPTNGWMPKPTTIVTPQASVGYRPAMVEQPIGMGDPLINHNFSTAISPRSTGPKSPPANVLACGSSSGTEGLENEELDLSLRL
ncbi:hypothetical protein ACJRO7_007404 [Eucalyptus globulus]|uniref:C2H2-type domain-containing protein n=1 Tax=Eucalyptus globulus TaxID=34317 RepID=A0ABD3ILZ5_EUCGL